MQSRQDTRVVAPVALLLEVNGETEACFTRNISQGGMFVVTRRDIAQDALVRVFIVREGLRIESKARVVNKAEDGVGLRFVNPAAEFSEGIKALMDDILHKDDLGGVDHETPHVSWSHIPDGKSWNWWRKSVRHSELTSLSHDGAALQARSRPKVGDTVIVFLSEHDMPDANLTCQAEVVRHTTSGFAVRFISPSIEFRRMVSVLRRR